jgi:ribosomal-protein-alanine N-acetyltransferase
VTAGKIVIERMQTADLDALMEIEVRSFSLPWSRQSYEELWPLESIEIWVGKVDGEIAGYYLVQTMADEQELHTFAVKPEYRKQGIGRKLLKHMTEGAFERGIGKIYLQVRPSNAEARSLYDGLGFKFIGKRRAYYRDNNEDALVMCLVLSEVKDPV